MRGLVRKQKVGGIKLAAARKLRRQMTPAEQAFWDKVRGGKLARLKIRRQQPIRGFVVDFYCDEIGLVIELDGGIHEEQAEADGERDAILRALGLRVLRFRNDQVLGRWEEVEERILKAID